MSLEDIRNRARTTERKVGWRNLREYAAAVFVVVAFGWTAMNDSSVVVRIGAALIMLAAVYVSYQLHARGAVRTMPGSMGLTDCVDFHRAELVRQRDLLQNVWSWYLLPFVPGMAVILIGRLLQHPERWSGALLASVAVGLVFYAVGALNARAARSIQARIEELSKA